jgi:heme/copper-type cytochrome/quinol oxidase subunit 4
MVVTVVLSALRQENVYVLFVDKLKKHLNIPTIFVISIIQNNVHILPYILHHILLHKRDINIWFKSHVGASHYFMAYWINSSKVQPK